MNFKTRPTSQHLRSLHHHARLSAAALIIALVILAIQIRAQISCPPAGCIAGKNVSRDFFVQVVDRLTEAVIPGEPQIPASSFAVDALVAWVPFENTECCWNPLATKWEIEPCDCLGNGVQ